MPGIGLSYFHLVQNSSNILCSYLDPYEYAERFCNLKNVSIMSLNIQSLPAKFQEFQELIHVLSSSKCSPDVICLQEIWQIHDNMNLSLPGYSKLEYRIRNNNVQGGGLVFMFDRILHILCLLFTLSSLIVCLSHSSLKLPWINRKFWSAMYIGPTLGTLT